MFVILILSSYQVALCATLNNYAFWSPGLAKMLFSNVYVQGEGCWGQAGEEKEEPTGRREKAKDEP